MKSELRQAFIAEMNASIVLYEKGEFERPFIISKSPHVLGQQYVAPHITTHYWMLRLGLKRRSLPKIWGQVIRIGLGAMGSAVGIVPVGNTGGTNISMFKRLPVEPHIQKLIT